jgi:hypothetical protein
MTDASIIAEFFGNILGAVFSFILYIFTEIDLWGVSLLHMLWVFIAFAMFILFIRVLLK